MVQSTLLFVLLCLRHETKISVLILPQPTPDWHIQHNHHAEGFYPRVSVIHKRFYNFPMAFSQVTLFELHRQIRHTGLFPFYRCVNQHKRWKAVAVHGHKRTRMAYSRRLLLGHCSSLSAQVANHHFATFLQVILQFLGSLSFASPAVHISV